MKLNALNPLLLFTFLSFSVAVLSQYYEANLEFDNKVPILEPIDNKNADSLVRCAMLCGSGCKCFSFNHYTGMCRSYNSCHILNMTSEAGWQFYRSPSLKTIDSLQFYQRCLNENHAYYEDHVLRSQYCIIKSYSTWDNAKINSESEQNWLKYKVSGDSFWTGAIKDINKNIWVWDHSGTELVFTNWDPNGSQPNGGNDEPCVVSEGGLWHDYSCDSTVNLICERGY